MANAFTLFGTLDINTSKFDSEIGKAEKRVVDLTSKLKDLDTELQHKQRDFDKTANQALDFGTSMQKVSDTINSATKSAKSFASSLNSVGEKIKGVGIGLSIYVTAPLVAMAKASFDAAVEIDGLRTQMIAVTGSIDAANAKIQEFAQLSKVATGVTLTSAAGTYAMAKGYGLSEEAAMSLVVALGKLKAANQSIDTTTFARNLVQIIDVTSKQDFNQAQKAWANFGATLSQAFGQDPQQSPELLLKQIRALKAEGKLTRDEFIRLTSAAILLRPELKNLSDPIGVRLEKQMSLLRLSMSAFGDAIAEAALPLLDKLTYAVGILAVGFKNLSPEMQRNIILWGAIAAVAGPALVAFGYGVQIIAKTIGIALIPFEMFGNVLSGLVVALPSLIVAAQATAEIFGILATAIGSVSAVVATLAFPEVAALIGAVAIAAVGLASALIFAASLFVGIYQAAKENLGLVATIFVGVGAIITDVWNTITDGLKTLWNDAVNEITAYWNAFGDEFKAIGKGLLIAIVGIIAIIKVLWDGLGKTLINTIIEALRIVGTLIKGLAYIIGGALMAVRGLLTGNLDLMAKGIGYFFSGVADIFTASLRVLFALLTTTAKAIVNLFVSIPASIASGAFENWRGAGQKASSGFAQGLLDNMPIIGKIVSFFKSAQGGGTDTGGFSLESFMGQVEAFAKQMSDKLASDIKDFQGKLKGGGAGLGAGKTGGGGLNDEQQKYKDLIRETAQLVDTKNKLNLTTNLEILNADIAAGKYGNLAKQTGNAVTEAARLAASNLDAAKATKEAQDAYVRVETSLRDLEIETSIYGLELQQTTDAIQEQIFNLKLSTSAFKDHTPEQKDAIKTQWRWKAALDKVAEAQKTLNAETSDVTKELLKLGDLNKKELTNMELFAILVAKNTELRKKSDDQVVAGGMALETLTDAQLDAIRIQIQLHNGNEALKKDYTNLSDFMKDLGLATEKAISPSERLRDILANPIALLQMAQTLGTTFDDLVAKIKNAVAEMEAPTFFGTLRKNLAELQKGMQEWTVVWADSLTMAIQGVGDVFANAFANWDGTAQGFFKSIAQGFRQLIGQIIGELVRLAAMRFIMMLVGAMIGGAVPVSGQGAAQSGAAAPLGGRAMGIIGRASGGLVNGAGTGVSDSIPAMLSNGEFVIPANVVKTLGVGFFEGLRNMQFAGASPMPSVSNVSDNRSSSVSNSNVFNINVAGGMSGNQTATMVQKEILKGLQKVDRRNR